MSGLPVFGFDVRGQKGDIPCVGLGTALLNNATCVEAVRAAIRMGYRLIDTALLYDNQEAVGEAIKQSIAAGEITRKDIFITSKVGFFPQAADGRNCFVPIKFHECNKKGYTSACEAIDFCLKLLQLDYVDLMLIHNPLTDINEYQASCAPHHFELAKSHLTASEREMILQSRLKRVKHDDAVMEAIRADTWRALEEAQAVGKCRFIGVSNYPVALMRAMEAYAKVMPGVNQLELHPRFSSPALRAHAQASGYVLTAYGSHNSVRLEDHSVVRCIAENHTCSPTAVVLRWTLQHGICVIPRSASAAHQAENLGALDASWSLSADEMAELDALDEAYPYYWWPMPSLPKGSEPDRCPKRARVA